MDANVYYGEERYQKMMVKATEDNGSESKPGVPSEYEDLQDGQH
jgi:hypothetical protein